MRLRTTLDKENTICYNLANLFSSTILATDLEGL